jgi:hypothetical protein
MMAFFHPARGKYVIVQKYLITLSHEKKYLVSLFFPILRGSAIAGRKAMQHSKV